MMRFRKIAAALCVPFIVLAMGTAAKARSPERTLNAIEEKASPTGLDAYDVGIRHQIECLALNLYHEARGTSEAEVMAVGFTTRNRVQKSDAKDYCETIWEKGQYVWTKRTVRDQMPKDHKTWNDMVEYATKIVTTDVEDTTNGATSFYSRHIRRPRWAQHVAYRLIIGASVFVRV